MTNRENNRRAAIVDYLSASPADQWFSPQDLHERALANYGDVAATKKTLASLESLGIVEKISIDDSGMIKGIKKNKWRLKKENRNAAEH